MEYTLENDTPFNSSHFFYTTLAGTVRTQLLTSLIQFDLIGYFIEKERTAPTIRGKKWVPETEIIEHFQLNPTRAKKWLHLLALQDFLDALEMNTQVFYSLGSISKNLYNNNSDDWWNFQFVVNSLQAVVNENLTDVLRGKNVQVNATWPPYQYEDAVILEEWMTRTSKYPLAAISNAINLNKVKHLLDIGGGDGTMACELAKKYPDLTITVYNLPETCALIQENIRKNNLSERVKVAKGDFLKEDTFPTGYELILFSRVLWDWSVSINRKLLHMAHAALAVGGRVAICEAFQENEHNKDPILVMEFRYIFWDDFETQTYKNSSEYKKLLSEVGFKILPMSTETRNIAFSVLIGEKINY